MADVDIITRLKNLELRPDAPVFKDADFYNGVSSPARDRCPTPVLISTSWLDVLLNRMHSRAHEIIVLHTGELILVPNAAEYELATRFAEEDESTKSIIEWAQSVIALTYK